MQDVQAIKGKHRYSIFKSGEHRASPRNFSAMMSEKIKTTILKKAATQDETSADETSVLKQFRLFSHSSDVIFDMAVEMPEDEMLHTNIYMGIIS